MHFAHPHFLWTLLILVPLIVWYVLKQRNINSAKEVFLAVCDQNNKFIVFENSRVKS